MGDTRRLAVHWPQGLGPKPGPKSWVQTRGEYALGKQVDVKSHYFKLMQEQILTEQIWKVRDLSGAKMRVIMNYHVAVETSIDAEDMMAQVLSDDFDFEGSVAQFNDGPYRTHEQIMDFLNICIAKAEEEEKQ